LARRGGHGGPDLLGGPRPMDRGNGPPSRDPANRLRPTPAVQPAWVQGIPPDTARDRLALPPHPRCPQLGRLDLRQWREARAGRLLEPTPAGYTGLERLPPRASRPAGDAAGL